MSKYIPKVGDKVLSEFGSECSVLYVGENHVFVRSDSEEFSAEFDYFEPIPTKADVERKKLLDILCVTADYVLVDVAKEIQKGGFTIPKKVKRSEIAQLIFSIHSALLRDQVLIITDRICNLLGDLVEDN